MIRIVMVVLIGICAGCPTIKMSDLEGVTLYYPPKIKFISEPRYPFTENERNLALLSLKHAKADTLFEIIIDNEGKVVKARVLKTRVRKNYIEDLESHARRFKFTKDPGEQQYRAFYYPVKYRYNSEVEWMN